MAKMTTEEARRRALIGAKKYYKPFKERLWSKIKKSGNGECWEWCGATTSFGHGVINKGHKLGTSFAHRAVWEDVNGAITDGSCVLHSCDNPRCCNPAHLWLGTRQDNMVDMIAKGRAKHPNGSDHPRAKLTEADVLTIRRLANSGISFSEIAKTFHVSKSAARHAKVGISWRHIT